MDLIVSRPAWVWDVRAPLHPFVVEHKRLNRMIGAMSVGSEYVAAQLTKPINEGRNVRKVLQAGNRSVAENEAWLMYEGPSRDGEAPPGSRRAQGFVLALKDAELFVLRSAIVMYASLFEAYVTCWALNYLLANLETGRPVNTTSARLARDLRERPHHVTADRVLQAFPEIWHGLAELPHVFKDLRRGTSVVEPIHRELNARNVILFWRRYRNHAVHQSALITDDFGKRHHAVWEELRKPYGRRLEPLSPGTSLPIGRESSLGHHSLHIFVPHRGCGNSL